MNKRLLLAASAAAACVLGSAGSAVAQAGCPSGGVGSVACITQIGDGNRTVIDQSGATGDNRSVVSIGATGEAADRNTLNLVQRGQRNTAAVTIRGRDNGSGAIRSESASVIKYQANAIQALLGLVLDNDDVDSSLATTGERTLWSTPNDLESGRVGQSGVSNFAAVAIAGRDNQFHVSQNGNSNTAVQLVLGAENTAAVVQGDVVRDTGGGAKGNFNTAVQAQVGAGNFAYAKQNGNSNTAVQVQVGPGAGVDTAAVASMRNPENAISEFAALSTGSNNRMMLEQSGGATAVLLQAGDSNLIALRQPSGGEAAISQFGSNLTVQLEQQRGRNGVTPIIITQTGG